MLAVVVDCNTRAGIVSLTTQDVKRKHPMKRDMEVVRQILIEIEETGACELGHASLKVLLDGEEPTPEE